MTLGTSGGRATFDGAGYSVTLSGQPSGSGSLTLNDSVGTGTLITVTDGTHAINARVVLADNLVVTTGGTNSWTFRFDTASSISQSGTGSYSLTMSGTGGKLILSVSDNYTGGTFVTAGTLEVTTPSASLMLSPKGWLATASTTTTILSCPRCP